MPATPQTYIGKSTVQKHIDQALTEIIQSDETLLGVFHGQALSGESYGLQAKRKGGFSLHDYLLITDQRVVMWARGIFSNSTDGFHYDDIASVEEARGLLLGEIVLNVRGAKERMRAMVKEDVPRAAQMIRERISAAKNGANGKSGAAAPPPPLPPSPPLPPTAQKAFLYLGEEVKGPYTRDQLRALLDTDVITSTTQVCREGSQDWLPLSSFLQ